MFKHTEQNSSYVPIVQDRYSDFSWFLAPEPTGKIKIIEKLLFLFFSND